MNKPDLSNLPSDVVRYIEYLENRLTQLENVPARSTEPSQRSSPAAPVSEPPTSVQIISISRDGIAKRTPRHLYDRQRRGGVGIYDLEVDEPDYPALLQPAEESNTLLLFTDRARAFRYPLTRMDAAPVRSKGTSVLDRLPLEPGEMLAAVLPIHATGNIALVSASGGVRVLRHHIFGEHMRPGVNFYNYAEFGPLVAACWTRGDEDLLIVCQRGMGIRFNQKAVSPQGSVGMRLADGDRVVAVTAVDDDSKVFFAGADGKGTIRQMSGFAANKAPGGGGKLTMRSDRLIGACTVTDSDDLFLTSRQGKIIRFRADEVPVTESPAQGVICMEVRFSEVTGLCRGTLFLD